MLYKIFHIYEKDYPLYKNPDPYEIGQIVEPGHQQVNALFYNTDLYIWTMHITHETMCDPLLKINFFDVTPFIFYIDTKFEVIGGYVSSGFFETFAGKSLRIIDKDFPALTKKIEMNVNFQKVISKKGVEWQGGL